MQLLYKTDRKSLFFLNIAQFMGAMNDNYFKLIVAFFLINVKGPEFASSILATAAAIFVIPFLIFSSSAGVLADRISKRSIIVAMKLTEVIVTSFSIIAVYFKSEIGLYALLFLVATTNAIFGPSKYGIIPELVESKKVSKANGLISSFTYLAIIIGTFLASFITDISNKNFFVTALACMLFALVGFISSIYIAKTPAKNSKKKITPFFLYEVYQSLVLSSKREHLLTCVFGSSFFLFIGSYTQLNIIPFAMQHLGLSEVGGGYLFLLSAVGIAIGSMLAGKISKDRVELGLSSLAGFCLAFLMILLCLFAKSLTMVIILLILLGMAGGLMLVPFDSFIQVKSPDQNRGQIIATTNFLGFFGALLAAATLYILNNVLECDPSSGFGIVGFITLLFVLILGGRTSNMLFPFFASKLASKYYKLTIESTPATASILILEKSSWLNVVLLYNFLPDLTIYVVGKKGRNFPFFNHLVKSIEIVEKEELNDLIKRIKETKKRDSYVCIFSKGKVSIASMQKTILNIFGLAPPQLLFVKTKKEKNQINYSFSE